jgi:hypothetical protein
MRFCMTTTSAKEVVELRKECYFLSFPEETTDANKNNFVATESKQSLHDLFFY